MPFDPSKDKVLKKWKCPETGLLITINRYDQGEAKVQIGPRILKKQDGSDRAPVKAGRLTLQQSLGCVRLALWDESRKRLVSFREARRKGEGRTAT